MSIRESIQISQFKSILQSNYGVNFYEKRRIQIPKLSKKYLYKFNPNDKPEVEGVVLGLNTFLDGQPIGDTFGKDHPSRRKWRLEMSKEFGEIFRIVYESRNQFRNAKLSMVRENIGALIDCAGRSNQAMLADSLLSLKKAVAEALKGYNSIESDQEKLAIVYLVEDSAIRALQLLAD